jgi:hypothetical protein
VDKELKLYNAGYRSFIDLGCGNGLLVYLLTQEGFEGGVGLVSTSRVPKITNTSSKLYLTIP